MAVKILLINDDEDDYLITRDLVSEIKGGGYGLDWAASYEDGLRAAVRNEHDVCLVDYRLGGRSGLDLIREARGLGASLPVMIMLTSQADRDTDGEAIAAGAADYLVKGETGPALLERSIRFALLRRRSEERLSYMAAIVQSSDDAIVGKKLDGTVTSWNAGAERMYGYSAEEMVGHSIYAIVPADKWDELRRVLKSLGQGERVERLQTTRVRKDGVRLEVALTVSPIRDSLGHVSGASAIARDITESLRAAEALRDSQERYRELFENANDIIFTLDLDGILTSVNGAGERILGYGKGELLGRRAVDFIPPERYEQMCGGLRREGGGEGPTAYEIDVTARDGRRVTLEVSSRIIYERGRVSGVQGTARDVTQRRLGEESLRRLNRTLAVLGHGNKVMIGASDEAMLLNNLCEMVVGVGGYRLCWVAMAGDDEGKSVRPAAQYGFEEGYLETLDLTWDDSERGRGPSGIVIRTGEPYVVQDVTADPAFRPWVDCALRRGYASTVSLPLTDGRRTIGVLNIYAAEPDVFSKEEVNLLWELADNISFGIKALRTSAENGRSVEALRASELQFRALFENAQDAVLVANDGGVYVDVNPAACELLGTTYEQLIGTRVRDITEPGRELETEAAWSKFIELGRMKGMFRVRRADGKLREVDFSAKANFLPGRHLSVLRDVTERCELEEQLRQAQKMEAVGRLAGGVAHDFNNLLTAIIGFNEMSARTLPPGDPLLPNLAEVKKAADRAHSLTRQLLAFSRRQVLQPKVLDLNGVVADMEKMLRRLIGEDVRLRTLLAQSLWSVRADPGQLEQVLMNLAVNARDAMPEGGSLTIETKNVTLTAEHADHHVGLAPGAYVLLAFSDTGVGMDAVTRARIFEPFFTTKEPGRGTGLGLSTAYGIVKQSGGDILADSEPGKGTAFRIYLPRAESGAPDSGAPAAAAEPGRGAESILLAEDEAVVRDLTRQVLEESGYKVLEAPNGAAALLLFQQEGVTIDLLLTDVVMPEMSGRQLADGLATIRPGLRVLYMSGYTADAVVRRGVMEDEAKFIQKPFSPAELLRKVREVLDAAPDKVRGEM